MTIVTGFQYELPELTSWDLITVDFRGEDDCRVWVETREGGDETGQLLKAYMVRAKVFTRP